MKTQKIILLMIFILILIVIIFYIPSLNENNVKITNFEECAAAGFPVMESYPRQCRDAEGNLFVEDIYTTPEEVKGGYAYLRSLSCMVETTRCVSKIAYRYFGELSSRLPYPRNAEAGYSYCVAASCFREGI